MSAVIGIAILKRDVRTREILDGLARELHREPFPEIPPEQEVLHIPFVGEPITGGEAWDVVHAALEAQGDWSTHVHLWPRPAS